ncbi:MAG: hypothetical protein RBR68_13865, partial [Tenuifilaceae bacterium]|nr:hypothetical protein [Tenuifilaceae bacterium]
KDKFIPILQFNSLDNNKEGTCDYYGLGTTLCTEHIETDIEFLKPLVTDAANLASLSLQVPPQSANKDTRGFPGDQALLSNKSLAYSTGTEWRFIKAETEELNKAIILTSPSVSGTIGQINTGTIITLKVLSISIDKYDIELYDGIIENNNIIYSKSNIEGNSEDNIIFSSTITDGSLYYKLTNNNLDNAEGSVVITYRFKYI